MLSCTSTRLSSGATSPVWSGHLTQNILMILLYHASKINLRIYLDHGTGMNRRLINVSELAESLGNEYCSTLLGYYVFSGKDCTKAFKGKGKVNALNIMQYLRGLTPTIRVWAGRRPWMNWVVGAGLDRWAHPPFFSC